MINGIGWFEIGTNDPQSVQRFYGDLFGWQFGAPEEMGGAYREITTPAADSIGGGLFDTGGAVPNYAVFYVQVTDVAATVRAAESAGGKVLVGPKDTGNGLIFAQLLDPTGNQFAVYSPPA
jgi:predicted enzyme related to lactoylglutathione lyase